MNLEGSAPDESVILGSSLVRIRNREVQPPGPVGRVLPGDREVVLPAIESSLSAMVDWSVRLPEPVRRIRSPPAYRSGGSGRSAGQERRVGAAMFSLPTRCAMHAADRSLAAAPWGRRSGRSFSCRVSVVRKYPNIIWSVSRSSRSSSKMSSRNLCHSTGC